MEASSATVAMPIPLIERRIAMRVLTGLFGASLHRSATMSVRRDISTHDEPRFPIASAMAEAVSASPAHLWTHDFSMLAMALCGCFWRALMTSPCGGRGCPLGRGGGAGATLTTRWPGMFTIPPQAGHLPRRPANSSLKCNTLPQAQVTRIGITGLFRLFGRSQHTVRIGESPIESRRRVDGRSTSRIDQVTDN